MRPVVPILLAIAIAGSSACSIKKMAANTIASTLADTGTTFTGDEDVQLVGDALPFALKLYESTLASTPNHQALLLATCSAFTQYAYAYIETAAEALPSSRRAEIQAARDRALRLYLRARGYCFRGLDARFGAKTSAALIQDPQSVVARAKEHFDKAVELQQGLSPGPYVSLATGVVVSSQDRAEFERLLKTALSIDPEKDPPNRLITLVTQQRARVLLDRIDERFSN